MFEEFEEKGMDNLANIKVIGVGGGGNNADVHKIQADSGHAGVDTGSHGNNREQFERKLRTALFALFPAQSAADDVQPEQQKHDKDDPMVKSLNVTMDGIGCQPAEKRHYKLPGAGCGSQFCRRGGDILFNHQSVRKSDGKSVDRQGQRQQKNTKHAVYP